MTISLKHAFASLKSDGGDSTLIQPSNWNAEHVLSLAAGKVLGRDTSSDGVAQELGLAFDASGNADFDVGTGGLGVPTGTTAERLVGARPGTMRYNSQTNVFEGYFAAAWATILGAVSPAITGTATLVNATFSGLLTLLSLAETYTAPTITAGVLTIDLSLSTIFNVANNHDVTTFTISNATANKGQAFTLFLTADGTQRAQTWGANVKWPSGNAPTLSSANGKVDVITFVTNDGGTTWFAFLGGLSFA